VKAPLRFGYGVATQIARAAAAVAPPGRGKVLRAFSARRGIRSRYAKWAREGRDPSRALVWIHAPSVGEGLQARPVIEIARAERPELQLAYTYFSPSARGFAESLPVDFRDYLPFDTRGDARAALAALRPQALVFSKLDVWPMLVFEADRQGVPVVMISATLASASSRRRRLAVALLRDAYSRLSAVGAVDEADADRLVSIGVRPSVITVTGDTRYDQVWARAAQPRLDGPLLASLRSDRPTMVAGSTWPADEARLLAAWLRVHNGIPGARLIIAPHEPTHEHLAAVEGWARSSALRLARLGSDGAREADVIVVDRTGVLGDLYGLATISYVGGGFHAAGLHSTLEPAAFGVPVLFGPRFHASRDAVLLLQSGGGACGEDAAALERQIVEWFTDVDERKEAGTAARGLVRAGLGAARRSYELIAGALR
jgi:3-deoxy-D-manno-octulosonic-acid transferase